MLKPLELAIAEIPFRRRRTENCEAQQGCVPNSNQPICVSVAEFSLKYLVHAVDSLNTESLNPEKDPVKFDCAGEIFVIHQNKSEKDKVKIQANRPHVFEDPKAVCAW